MSKNLAKIPMPQPRRNVPCVIAASNDNRLNVGRPARPRLACQCSCSPSPDRERSFAVTAVLVHEVHGRMRFVVSALKGDHAQAAALCEHLLATRSVQTTHFNSVTGSLVVTYDPLVGTRDVVLRALGELGVSVSFAPRPTSAKQRCTLSSTMLSKARSSPSCDGPQRAPQEALVIRRIPRMF